MVTCRLAFIIYIIYMYIFRTISLDFQNFQKTQTQRKHLPDTIKNKNSFKKYDINHTCILVYSVPLGVWRYQSLIYSPG